MHVIRLDAGIPGLYLCGAGCMALMVVMVFLYVQRFGTEKQAVEAAEAASLAAGNKSSKPPNKVMPRAHV